MDVAEPRITIEIKRGNTWVKLDNDSVRWEVTDEIADQCGDGATNGMCYVGGMKYRWTMDEAPY